MRGAHHPSGAGSACMGMAEGTSQSMRMERCEGEMVLVCFCEITNSGKQEKKREKRAPFGPTNCLHVGKSHKITKHASQPSGNSTRCLK